jgi:hypothetical protein
MFENFKTSMFFIQESSISKNPQKRQHTYRAPHSRFMNVNRSCKARRLKEHIVAWWADGLTIRNMSRDDFSLMLLKCVQCCCCCLLLCVFLDMHLSEKNTIHSQKKGSCRVWGVGSHPILRVTLLLLLKLTAISLSLSRWFRWRALNKQMLWVCMHVCEEQKGDRKREL